VGAAGVHLAATDPVCAVETLVVGRSCHRVGDIGAAAASGAAYATLSPVFETASKPGYGPALGPAALAGHPVPVYGLGGVDAAGAAACFAAGAAGVAVMGALMHAPDVADATVALLDAARTATVVLVHGGLGETDANRFWTLTGVTAAMAAAGFRVLAPDRAAWPCPWRDESAALARALAREPERLTVVAGSNGCSAALRLALDHPTRVGRLVLCWPATPDPAEGTAIRGVTDEELRRLDIPVDLVPTEPEDSFHQRVTVDHLVALLRRGRTLAGSPPPPRPDFGPALGAFVRTIADAARS
jgi:hypothetical protein